jgi:hypothetical protein
LLEEKEIEGFRKGPNPILATFFTVIK